MKLARKGFLLLALLWTALAVASPPSDLFTQPATPAQLLQIIGPVVGELRAAQSLRGQYTQKKHLPELPKPLIATGDFLFVRGRGIVWRTQAPFASELAITADALIQRDGGKSLRIGAEQQPAVRMVAQIFFAVFSLDLESLEKMFVLHGRNTGGDGWQLGLKPRQAGSGLHEIEVHGHAHVERVILREARGDLTEIELRTTTAASAAPAAADLKPFEP